MPLARNKQILGLLPILAIIGLIIISYLPGVRGPLVFDDIPHIKDNPVIVVKSLSGFKKSIDYIVRDSGNNFKKPLAAFSFAVNYYLAGGTDNTLSYKLTNILIHITNFLLVFWLSHLLISHHQSLSKHKLIFSPYAISWLIAAIWALHPIQLTSVLYVVQRMTSLSALFVFAGLIVFIIGRKQLTRNHRSGFSLMTVGLLGGLILGILNKENAVLILVLAPLIDYTFFGGPNSLTNKRRSLWFFYIVTVLLPVAGAALWCIANPEFILNNYSRRPFTLMERVMTEGRVLWQYVSLILFPNLSEFTLYHDDITISKSLIRPWSTLPALLSIFIVIFSSIFAMILGKFRVFAFSVLWFLIGHSIESSFIALEIMHEHRNYLPSYGIIFGIVYLFVHAIMRIKLKKQIFYFSVVAFCSLLVILTTLRASRWSSESSLIYTMAINHPRSARSQFMLGELYSQSDKPAIKLLAAYRYYNAYTLAPYEPSSLIKFVTVIADNRVYNELETSKQSADVITIDGSQLPLARVVRKQKLFGKLKWRIHPLVDRKITSGLMHGPINKGTINNLSHFYICLIERQGACKGLIDIALPWFIAASKNPNIQYQERRSLYEYISHLHLTNRDIKKAIRTAKSGLKSTPDSITLKLILANAHIINNELEKAEQILLYFNKMQDQLDNNTRNKIHALNQMLEAKKLTKNK